MANITLAFPDDILNAGRKYAQKYNTSLNDLIRTLLIKVVSRPATQLDQAFRLADKLKAKSSGKKWKREDIYDV